MWLTLTAGQLLNIVAKSFWYSNVNHRDHVNIKDIHWNFEDKAAKLLPYFPHLSTSNMKSWAVSTLYIYVSYSWNSSILYMPKVGFLQVIFAIGLARWDKGVMSPKISGIPRHFVLCLKSKDLSPPKILGWLRHWLLHLVSWHFLHFRGRF